MDFGIQELVWYFGVYYQCTVYVKSFEREYYENYESFNVKYLLLINILSKKYCLCVTV